MSSPIPRLTWQEGAALGALAVLLGQGTKPVPTGYDASTVAPASDSAFVRVARQRIVRRCLHTLLHEGGHQHISVLRDGRRTEGSLLSPALNTDFALHFGPMTDAFVRAVLPKLPEWMGKARDLKAVRGRGRRWAKGVLKGRSDRPGDWLFLALVQANLPRLALPDDTEQALAIRARVASPLGALWALRNHPHGTPPKALLEPRAVRLVECLQHRLRRAWASTLDSVLTGRAGPERTVTRLTEIHVVWTQWVQALDEAGRLDLAGPVLGAVLDVIGTDGPGDMRGRLRVDMPNARTADQVCHAAADILATALTLREHHQILRTAGYGSDRYDESLLLTDVIEAVDAPGIDVSATIASLRGRIG